MDFKTFYFSLPIPRRTEFAEEIGTTTGYCHQIAYGKRIELGIADVIVNASAGQIKLHELPLTDRAIFQSKARESITKDEAS